MENGHPRVAIFYLFRGGEKRALRARVVAKAAGSKAVALQGAAGPRDVGESPSRCREKQGLAQTKH
ncbi:MAG: hypothetical protein V7631_4384 [Massilia sp.]|jgi:hypothetical protein